MACAAHRAAPARVIRNVRTLHMSYGPTGFDARLDNLFLFSQILLPTFVPLVSWRLVLGARCGSEDDAHWVERLTFARGSSLGVGYAHVQLAANSRDFTHDAVSFTYYTPPIVSTIEPSVGPLAGGTVVTLRGSPRKAS